MGEIQFKFALKLITWGQDRISFVSLLFVSFASCFRLLPPFTGTEGPSAMSSTSKSVDSTEKDHVVEIKTKPCGKTYHSVFCPYSFDYSSDSTPSSSPPASLSSSSTISLVPPFFRDLFHFYGFCTSSSQVNFGYLCECLLQCIKHPTFKFTLRLN